MNRKHWHRASAVFASRTFFVTQVFSLRFFLRTLFLLVPLLLVGGAAGAWQGHVVKVLDGDTIEVKNCNDKIVRIHLYGVEAPRISQYYGKQCAKYFSGLVRNRSVRVINVGRDALGRMRSFVWVDGMNVNEEMVKAGYAWVSNPVGLSRSCEKWMDMQTAARENKSGLWRALDVCLADGVRPDLPRSCPIF
jgi:endonuclease YncB( thermonuclease family)